VLFAKAWLFRNQEFVNASSAKRYSTIAHQLMGFALLQACGVLKNHTNNYHVIMHALSLIRVTPRLPPSQILSAAHGCWHQQVRFSAMECHFDLL
jgi:hypothetical protein